MMLETERLVLRRFEESDAEDLYRYASDPVVGPIAGWPPHQSIEESLEVIRTVFCGAEAYAVCLKSDRRAIGAILRHAFEDLGMSKVWCGYYDGNNKSKRVQEKVGFQYQWTTEGVSVHGTRG